MNKYTKYIAAAVLVLGLGVFAFSHFSAPNANAQEKKVDTTKTASSTADMKTTWSVRCEKKEDFKADHKRGKCEMYQRQDMKNNGQRVIELAIGYPKDQKEARGIFILPMGILLTPGSVKLTIDDGAPMNFDVRYCLPNGCYAYVTLSDDVLSTMSKGTQAVVEVTNASGKKLDIPMPLKGFTAALKEIQD